MYQRYGFYPRFLTAILSKQVGEPPSTPQWSKFSDSFSAKQDAVIQSCNRLTDSLFGGLNVEREIRAVHAQNLGDTVLLWDGNGLTAFGVCHCGPGTEAGNNKCYVKFAAVSSVRGAPRLFDQLLDACESFAISRGMTQLEAGVNLGRYEAYRRMLERGYRIDRLGVAMHRPNESGYSRPGIYVIDDWR